MQRLSEEKIKVIDKFRLDDKIAVVTGALGLLGPVWIRGLLEAGASVVGIDLQKAKISKIFVDLQKNMVKN